jgi:NADH:ubiquinone oxidoreductase subunit 6 (subunit J)
MYILSLIVLIITISGAIFMVSNKPKSDVANGIPSNLPEANKIELANEITKKYKWVFNICVALLILAILTLVVNVYVIYNQKMTGKFMWLNNYILPSLLALVSITLIILASILGYIDTEKGIEEFKSRWRTRSKTKSVSIPESALFKKTYVPGTALTIGCVGLLFSFMRFYGY